MGHASRLLWIKKHCPRALNPNWREEQYRSIHSIAKRCGLEERLLNYMKRNFHVEHLRELQNDELMRVYRYIVGAKSRMKNPS